MGVARGGGTGETPAREQQEDHGSPSTGAAGGIGEALAREQPGGGGFGTGEAPARDGQGGSGKLRHESCKRTMETLAPPDWQCDWESFGTGAAEVRVY